MHGEKKRGAWLRFCCYLDVAGAEEEGENDTDDADGFEPNEMALGVMNGGDMNEWGMGGAGRG